MTINRNPSPLRYPGGKFRLYRFIRQIIQNLESSKCTYVEPFAGGAGVAVSLLIENAVDKVIINDYDKAIYSFWRAIKEEPQNLIQKIQETPITIEEWKKQVRIYKETKKYTLELAFATLFLNRTNRSGILNAGPIGGHAQQGEWKLNVRFNKEDIIEKINSISKQRNKLYIYNKDCISFLRKLSKINNENFFFYFDPPYYNKGQKLYKNFLTPKDHIKIYETIKNEIHFPWLLTYDDIPEIEELYKEFERRRFDLTYSASNKGTASELMIFSNIEICPSAKQMKTNKININLR